MVGEGGAAGDGRGNAVLKKPIGVYCILRIAVYLRLILLGRSRAPPLQGGFKPPRSEEGGSGDQFPELGSGDAVPRRVWAAAHERTLK